MQDFLAAMRSTLVTLVLTGLCYPLLVTGIALVAFPHRAGGSMVAVEQGRIVGSELIAQRFSSAAYLSPRPSAAGEKGYDATSSGGSNLGPTSKALMARAAKEMDRLQKDNPQAPGPVPAELLATSASGLDPHLSPQAALWQGPRVAKARGIAEERVRAAIEAAVEPRDLFVLGEPRVNVLLLNLALDRQFGRPPKVSSR